MENKCDKQMFLVYHDFVAETVDLNRSDDGGKTWDTAPTPVTNDGDAPGSQDVVEGADQGANTFQGPMAVNQQNGDVYIVFAISSAQGNVTTGVPPYGDPEQIVVASSHDNGKTFDLHLVQGGGPGEAAGEIFPWITLDKAGTVYVSYAYRAKDTDPLNIVMTHSKDRGQTWSKPAVVNTDNTSGSHIYSTISAGDPGKVDVAWYTGDKIDPSNTNQDWHVDFAQVTNADTTNPTVHQSRPYPDRIHHGDVCLNGLLCILGGDRSLLDFFQVQVGENGMANIAFDNNGSPDNTRRVWYARQTSGPGIGNALHDSQYCGQSPSGGGGGGGGGALPGPHVRLHLSDRTPARNTTVKFHTRLGRCTGNANTTIDLQKDTKGKFVTIDKTKLNKRCRATFKLKAAFKKGRFRTYWPKQSRKYRAGRSKPRTVTTH